MAPGLGLSAAATRELSLARSCFVTLEHRADPLVPLGAPSTPLQSPVGSGICLRASGVLWVLPGSALRSSSSQPPDDSRARRGLLPNSTPKLGLEHLKCALRQRQVSAAGCTGRSARLALEVCRMSICHQTPTLAAFSHGKTQCCLLFIFSNFF